MRDGGVQAAAQCSMARIEGLEEEPILSTKNVQSQGGTCLLVHPSAGVMQEHSIIFVCDRQTAVKVALLA